jgi:hypothetical protein
MEIYIKTNETLPQVAARLSSAVNVADQNPTEYQREQLRHSENHGGAYYLFEVLGLTIILVKNAGEVEVLERAGWPYYAIVQSDTASHEFLREIARHVARLLTSKSGFETDVADLSA